MIRKRPLKLRLSVLLGIALLVSGPAYAGKPLEIDASSDASTLESWSRMTESIGAAKREQLLIALVKLNLVGVTSAYQIVDNPELHKLSPIRIKDKIAGLTADEIIDLADRTATVKAMKTDRSQ